MIRDNSEIFWLEREEKTLGRLQGCVVVLFSQWRGGASNDRQ